MLFFKGLLLPFGLFFLALFAYFIALEALEFEPAFDGHVLQAPGGVALPQVRDAEMPDGLLVTRVTADFAGEQAAGEQVSTTIIDLADAHHGQDCQVDGADVAFAAFAGYVPDGAPEAFIVGVTAKSPDDALGNDEVDVILAGVFYLVGLVHVVCPYLDKSKGPLPGPPPFLKGKMGEGEG
jgi:hypothetical protein